MHHIQMDLSLSSLSLLLMLLISLKLSSSSNTFSLTTDENALLAFKNSTTTSDWTSHNWSSNTPVCRWAGVSCSPKHRRVTALDVSGFGLAGTVSPHLGNLTFLRSLNISRNNFTGSIPSELSNLRRLIEMDAGFNSFGGEIPAWFGALPRLRRLHLPNNNFTGELPSSVANISGLETLGVAYNFLEGKLPEGLFGMPALREIDVKFNRISDKLPSDMCSNRSSKLRSIILSGNQFYGEIPANISECGEIEELKFRENQFSGNIPSDIGRLTMLTTISVHSNNLQGSIPSFVFNISSLRLLSLSKNNFSGSFPTDIPYNLPHIEEMYFSDAGLTGGIPKEFGNLTTMKTLELQSNTFTGELPHELGNLSYLNTFKAAYNNLFGSIPSSIFNISTLTVLYLQQNLFSGTLPSNLGLSIASLQIFILHYNRLTGNIPTTIVNASKLTVVELNRNFLTGSIPDFGNLRQLETLRLWENYLTGAESPTQEITLLSTLSNCRNLKILEISNNPLNGILPSSIGNLSSTSLVGFYASACNINGGIPSEIGNLTGLGALYLAGNQLTGSIPREIGKLENLVKLYLSINRLDGNVPREICRLSNLVNLDLSNNMLTGALHECLGEVRTLREISFSSNRLNSTIPSRFWDLSDLISLDLSSNYMYGELSSRIGSWKISTLNLSFNQFSGGIPGSIEGCLSLEYLSLSNNKFGGAIPESLGKVLVLALLDLSNNHLSGSIPMSLENLRVLKSFNVSYNRLEGEIPDKGCFEYFNATSFVHNSGLCGAARFQVPRCHGRSNAASLIVKYVVPCFIAAIILVVIIVLLIRRRRKQKNAPPPVDDSLSKIAWRRISYIDLVQGTSSFSEINLLGRGSFGSVFKATLSDGLNIAVKVFNLELEGASKSFDTESKILSSVRHRNLLPIIGCCTNTEFRALILAYMPNGSLEKWLHSDGYYLDLMQRLKIAMDVALALEYLHHGHTFPVVHCDIKPSNILLDEDMTAHVGDFGISKLFDEGEALVHTKTLATIGYAAPEYGSEGKVSTSGDVYSYGILLLEMFTGKKPTDDMFDEEMSIVGWVKGALQENGMGEVVAPALLSTEDQHFSEHEQCVLSVFDLAMKCLVSCPDERTNMVHVAPALHRIIAKVTAAAEVANMRRRG